jgi:hypothetical protein
MTTTNLSLSTAQRELLARAAAVSDGPCAVYVTGPEQRAAALALDRLGLGSFAAAVCFGTQTLDWFAINAAGRAALVAAEEGNAVTANDLKTKSTRELLTLISAARRVITKRYSLDPRHIYDPVETRYWHPVRLDGLILAKTPEAVRRAIADERGEDDPVLDMDAPEWCDLTVVETVALPPGTDADLVLVLVDHQDGEGLSYLWLDTARRVGP